MNRAEGWGSRLNQPTRGRWCIPKACGCLTRCAKTIRFRQAAYASAANARGMVEFLVPTGGKISVIGLRAKGDGTVTTIPVLAK